MPAETWESLHTTPQDLARLLTSFLLLWTVMFFVWSVFLMTACIQHERCDVDCHRSKRNPYAFKQRNEATASDFIQGVFFSFVATIANSAIGLLRKQFVKVATVAPGHQVGVSTMIQGFVALVYCQTHGISLTQIALSREFALPALSSSVLNAISKTFETYAYATTDVSLCAPFLAFDPVMQFLLPAIFAPAACSLLSVGCGLQATFPMYHPVAVLTVAAAAFLLTSIAKAPKKDDDHKVAGAPSAGSMLPLGSKLILLNCVIYSFTSRLDKAAIRAAGKTVYYTFGRIAMASTCFSRDKPSRKVLREFAKPKAACLLIAVCVAEAIYMLSLYQAFARISPVYVTAIKRGGGLLISSLAGVLFFNEPLSGRLFPILAIVAGVLALCL